jgi:hypothetical protein
MADQGKLQVVIADMLEVLKAGKLQEHSVETITAMKDKKQFGEALNLLEKFTASTAFIDHDEMCTLMGKAWLTYCDVLTHDGKNLKKKLQKLEEDKKTEPDVLAKCQGQMDDLTMRKTIATSTASKYKYMNLYPVEKFSDPAFDAVKELHAAKSAE